MYKVFSIFLFIFIYSLFNVTPVHAATYTVSGTVKDSAGTPIQGATVSVNDANNTNTTTGSNGEYSLSVEQGTYNVGVTPPPGSEFGPAIALNNKILDNLR